MHDAAFAAAVNDVVDSLRSKPDVRAVRSPLDRPNAGQISRNGHAALVEFDIKGGHADAQDKVAAVPRLRPPRPEGAPRLHDRASSGSRAPTTCSAKTFGKDIQRAEYTSVPVTLVILLVAFGALVAAGLPVLLAFSAVLARSA